MQWLIALFASSSSGVLALFCSAWSPTGTSIVAAAAAAAACGSAAIVSRMLVLEMPSQVMYVSEPFIASTAFEHLHTFKIWI